MPLGFDAELFLNNPVERETRQAMLTGIQQLGQQVQQGIRSIATNRDLRSMGDELRNVNPQSNDFAFRMVDIISNHPLAVTDPRGIAVINILGNAHKEHQAMQLRQSGPSFAPLSGGRGILDRRTGEVSEVPPEMQPFKRPVSTKSGAVVDPMTGEELFPAPAPRPVSVPAGGTLVNPQTGEPIFTAPPKPGATGLNQLSGMQSRLLLNRQRILKPFEDAMTEAKRLDQKANDIAFADPKKPQDQSDPSTSAGQARQAAQEAARRANAIQNDPFLQSQLQATDSALMEIIRAQQGSAAPASIPATGSFTFGAGAAPTSPVQSAPQIMRWTRDASGRSIPVR